MRKMLKKVLGTLRKLQYSKHIKTVPRESVILDVPYFSQWESPNMVESILTNKINPADDPSWKTSGAKTKDEYALWSANGCGMACTKMILANELGKVISIVELGNKCVEYGVYTMPLEQSSGLIYRPYAKYLATEFGIDAYPVLPLTINQIIYELSRGNYVIASVSPKIRHINDIPMSKGGHLVLMLGYNLDKKELYFHNPSGFVKDTQQYASISFKDFLKFFGSRGVIVKSSKLVH